MNFGTMLRCYNHGVKLGSRSWLYPACSVVPSRTIVMDLKTSETLTIGSPTEDRLKHINFPPFLKSLFLGNFNKSILSYAEVLNYDRYYVLQEQTRQLDYFMEENKELIESIDERGVVPEQLLKKMQHLELSGLHVPKVFGGAQLLHTEAVRLLQQLGKSSSLAELFRINETMGTKAIVEHGSEFQKEKYLEGISKGDIWTATCIAEECAGSDPNSIRTLSTFNSDSNTYKMKGTKTWVSNALRADVFLVFSQMGARNYLGEETLDMGAFLVDRDTPGITISQPYDLSAYNGLQVCDVTFDCELPSTSLIGEAGDGLKVYESINHVNKYYLGAIVVARLEELLNITINHILARKQYGAKLADFELIKLAIARCTSYIYALESMLYITSGLADVGKNPDTELESTVVKIFAAQASNFVTRTCLDILGAKTNIKDSVYQKFLAENQVLQSWQGSSNILKCFVGISGLLHIIDQKGEELKRAMEPGRHPFTTFKYTFKHSRELDNYYPKRFKLYGYVHPRLGGIAEKLDAAASKINPISEKLLIGEGLNIQVHERNLEIISDLCTEVYAMVCTIARASRAYVVGHPHANMEIDLAIPFIMESSGRFEVRINEILKQTRNNADTELYYKSAGDYVIKQGKYCPVNPLTKNSF